MNLINMHIQSMINVNWFSRILQKGKSALIKAAKYGKTDVVVKLVKAGANFDLQNKVYTVL